MDAPIYITGSGIISAIGNDKQAVLSSLLEKRSGIGQMRYLQSEHLELPVGEVKLSDAEMREMLCLSDDKQANRTSLMGTIAMAEAISEAKVSDSLDKAFFISGTTVGGIDYTERSFLDIQE